VQQRALLGEGLGLLEKGLGCTLPEVRQQAGSGWRRDPLREHPDGEIIRAGAHARGASRVDKWRPGDSGWTGELVRRALRLIVEEALEGEVSDLLGRERYERGNGEKAGYRNGYRPGRVKTAEGVVDYSASQVRDTPEPFVSGVRAALSGRTRELERLAVELYARGLSTRDIEDAFTDEPGRRLLSRAAVSEITEKLWTEYEDFCKRDLSQHAIAYLFIDGIAERLRPGQRREAVLAAWGIGEDGRKSLLGLTAGSKEDVETVRAFFQNLRARGLGDPRLVVSDGAPGVIRAIEECFPRSARQRCLAHRMRNLAAKVPGDPWPEFKARVTACYQAPSRAIARQLVDGIRADFADLLAECARLFEDDFEACVAPTCGCRSLIAVSCAHESPRTAVRRGTAKA
jgi:putative transposase